MKSLILAYFLHFYYHDYLHSVGNKFVGFFNKNSHREAIDSILMKN